MGLNSSNSIDNHGILQSRDHSRYNAKYFLLNSEHMSLGKVMKESWCVYFLRGIFTVFKKITLGT